jgi:hypothetical protein
MAKVKMSRLRKALVGGAALLLTDAAIPAHAVSWGGFSFDPNPVHPSIGVPGVTVEARPLDPLHPLPSVHVGGNGEIAKGINGLNSTIQSAPTEAVQQALSPVGVMAGVMAKPFQDAGTAVVDQAAKAVKEIEANIPGDLIKLLIEGGLVLLVFRILFGVVSLVFRRRA